MNNVAVTVHNLNNTLSAVEVVTSAHISRALATAKKAWPEHAYFCTAAFERGDYIQTASSIWFFAGSAGEELAGA